MALPASGGVLPKPEVIAGAEREWVVPSMEFNGLRMSIQRFELRGGSVQRVMEFHENQWRNAYDAADILRSDSFDAGEISVHTGEHFITVQAERTRAGTTRGHITVTEDPLSADLHVDSPLPIPARFEIAMRQSFADGARDGEKLVLYSELNLDVALDRLHQTFHDSGWTVGVDRESAAQGIERRVFTQNGKSAHVHAGRDNRIPEVRSVMLIFMMEE